MIVPQVLYEPLSESRFRTFASILFVEADMIQEDLNQLFERSRQKPVVAIYAGNDAQKNIRISAIAQYFSEVAYVPIALGPAVVILDDRKEVRRCDVTPENIEDAIKRSALIPPRPKEGVDPRYFAPGMLALPTYQAKLDNLVGLSSVKAEIRSLASLAAVTQMRNAQGLPNRPFRLNFIFTGGPGTGKTTVASILGEVLKFYGFLPRGHFIQVDRPCWRVRRTIREKDIGCIR